jgi:hypothetical protein
LTRLGAGARGNPASTLTIDDVVDDSIVREIETGGFIERIYR